ncbi:hypothetical protein [Treponema socranskii]|uniref:hypothetical protein n=1 Tax=Treponema socranskii TaxID=53419 RepID=UPI003D6F3CAC
MENIIGGEFKISIPEITDSNDALCNLFSSGRGALSAILEKMYNEDITMHKCGREREGGVLLPDYLCSSITQVCIDRKIPYRFYHIREDLLPDEKDIFTKLDDNSVVLLISYFGLIDTDSIAAKIKKHSPNIVIIIDDVQNFYSSSESIFWDYRFNSYRKWFAVPDGAEIFCKFGVLRCPEKENEFAQYKFSGNILKNFSGWVNDSICLDLIEKGEEFLDKQYDCKCSKISKALINQIPYEKIKDVRKRNAKFIHDELEKLGIKHIYNEMGVPLFIPIFLDNRNEVRKEMFENNIFTPVHWLYESEELNGNIKNHIYDTELSLICDQRYSLEEMEIQIEVLKKCI